MMPEKIWAHLRQLGEEATPENTTWNTFNRGTEYIRADVHEAEVARLNAEIKALMSGRGWLDKALEQLREIVDRHYDDCMDVDATDANCVSGLKWEDGCQWTWTELAPELAQWLQENR